MRRLHFFEPNGIRLERPTVTASADALAGYRREARAACNACTREKQSRTTAQPA